MASKSRYYVEKDSSGKRVIRTEPQEMVDHPQHYGGDHIYEVIKVLDAWKLGFYEGNIVKYIARAKHKNNELEDLQKAQWYLNRLIQHKILEQNGVNNEHS